MKEEAPRRKVSNGQRTPAYWPTAASALGDLPRRGLLMLELSDLLWRYLNHPPSQAEQPRDRAFLKKGIDFFKEARRGANILHETAGLVPDVDAISAYLYAKQGLQTETQRAYANATAGNVFIKYEKVLEGLREGKVVQEPGFREEVMEAQAFFDRLSEVSLRLASKPEGHLENILAVMAS